MDVNLNSVVKGIATGVGTICGVVAAPIAFTVGAVAGATFAHISRTAKYQELRGKAMEKLSSAVENSPNFIKKTVSVIKSGLNAVNRKMQDPEVSTAETVSLGVLGVAACVISGAVFSPVAGFHAGQMAYRFVRNLKESDIEVV